MQPVGVRRVDAGEPLAAPARTEMESDVARYEMQPLFIPGVTDRI